MRRKWGVLENEKGQRAESTSLDGDKINLHGGAGGTRTSLVEETSHIKKRLYSLSKEGVAESQVNRKEKVTTLNGGEDPATGDGGSE